MTAPNHALTGAVIGLTVSNPVLALPLAVVSHFACDMVPHYDPPETNVVQRLRSKRFFREFIIVGAALCFLVVLVLAVSRPRHWLVAAICAFLAVSPDLFWLPRFLRVRSTGKDVKLNPFLKLHEKIQINSGSQFLWVEAIWFVVFGSFIASRL